MSANVLIETYWNVKIGMMKQVGEGVVVLIETYWNVKATGRKLVKAGTPY